MKNKKLAAIPLLITIALSVFGFAYATWSDYVQIEGTVEMGSLTIAYDYIEPPLCREFYKDPVTGVLVEGEWLGKDVGDQSAWYDDYVYDEHADKKGYKTLIIEVTNAYPQYIVHVVFKLHNIGTIPAVIQSFTVTGRDVTDGQDLTWDPALGALVDPVVSPIINIEIVNALPYQLDPCKTNKMQIDMDFKQEAEECHTYTFKVTIEAIQWNKA